MTFQGLFINFKWLGTTSGKNSLLPSSGCLEMSSLPLSLPPMKSWPQWSMSLFTPDWITIVHWMGKRCRDSSLCKMQQPATSVQRAAVNISPSPLFSTLTPTLFLMSVQGFGCDFQNHEWIRTNLYLQLQVHLSFAKTLTLFWDKAAHKNQDKTHKIQE